MNNIISFLKKYNILLILLSIIMLGSILRFKGLVFNSYWLDELYSASGCNPSGNSFDNMVKVTLEIDHPPLYRTVLWLWYKIFGFTEYAGRSLSAIFGILGIVTIFFLGKELFNKYIGLYSALFVSINIFLMKYSQETRSYGLFFFVAMLSFLYLYRVLLNQNKSNIILYWITTILLFYTHYFAFFIVASQLVIFIIYIIYFSNNKKSLLILSLYTSGIFTISIMPLIPYILAHADLAYYAWIGKPSPFYFIDYLKLYFGNVIYIVYIGGIISLIYLLKKSISKKERFSLVLLLIWLVLGFFLPYLKSVLSAPILVPRYSIVVIAPIILVASYGFWRIRAWGYLLVSVYFLYSLQLLFFNYYGIETKSQFREVLEEVVKYKQVPIYEKIPYDRYPYRTNVYQTYADMLRLDINIQDDINLTQDLKNGNLPECFWVLNAHIRPNYTDFPNYKIENSEILKNTSIQIVKRINYKDAEGYLLSYKIEPEICAKKVGSSVGN